MYSYGTPHMAKQKQDNQLEFTYSSYVRTQEEDLPEAMNNREDLPEAMNNREKWRERVRDICAGGMTWWWWWWWCCIYTYKLRAFYCVKGNLHTYHKHFYKYLHIILIWLRIMVDYLRSCFLARFKSQPVDSGKGRTYTRKKFDAVRERDRGYDTKGETKRKVNG